MHLQLGQLSTIVISSPEAAEQVMKTHDISFASRPFNISVSVLAYNSRDVAFSPYGDYWRKVKKICTLKLLSAKRVQSFKSVREEEVSRLIKSISAAGPVNLSTMSMALSYRILSRTAFGRTQEQVDSLIPMVQEMSRLLGGFSISDVFPSVKLLQVVTGMKARLHKLHQETDEILETIIKEHRVRIGESENFGSKVGTEDLVDVLLDLQDEGELATEDTKAAIMDLFVAGYETSPSVIEWTMSEIIKNPEVLKKTQTEVRKIYNGKKTVDESNLCELKYLKLVLKESLRLHPPSPMLVPREARERVEIWGYEIPEKTQAIVNAWAIGRDPRYWKEPERFNPERFVDSSIDYKGKDFEFIPFGSGRRICPGMGFGMSVTELALANLLYHFDWKIPNRKKPEDLDMAEAFGIAVKRKDGLLLIPIPYI